MGSVLAAVAAIAAVFNHSGSSTGKPQTLFTLPSATVAAFAQDGPAVAWFQPGGRACNTVQLRSLENGLKVDLPAQAKRNVTCRFNRSVRLPVGLALAYTSGQALWTLPQYSPLPLDYLVGAGVTADDRAERRFQEIAHTARGVGQWLGGVAGDRDTLVYAVTTVDFQDEAGCLAGSAPCTLVRSGGGVYRIVGRTPVQIPGTGPAVAVAASGTAVAYVGTSRIGRSGRPTAGADMPIEVVDAASGQEISAVAPEGVPAAIALTPHTLAALERTPLGLRLAWYDRATGDVLGSIPVPKTTSPQLTANDRLIAFRVGRSLRAVDVSSHRARVLARAAATPIGLSLEGSRLAWAENLGGSARIRALYVNGRG